MEKQPFLDDEHPIVAPLQIIECLDDVFDLTEHFRLMVGHPALMLNLSQDQFLQWHPHLVFTPSADLAHQLRSSLLDSLIRSGRWKISPEISSMKEDIALTKERMKVVKRTPTFVCWTWINVLRKALTLIQLLPPKPGSLFSNWLKCDLPTLSLQVEDGKLPPLPVDVTVFPITGYSSPSSSSDLSFKASTINILSSSDDVHHSGSIEESSSSVSVEKTVSYPNSIEDFIEKNEPTKKNMNKNKHIQLSSDSEDDSEKQSGHESDEKSSIDEEREEPSEESSHSNSSAKKQRLKKKTPAKKVPAAKKEPPTKKATPPKKTTTTTKATPAQGLREMPKRNAKRKFADEEQVDNKRVRTKK